MSADTSLPATGSRAVVLMLTVPETMVGDDLPTLRRKLRADGDRLIELVAAELHRSLADPDLSPRMLIARVEANLKATEHPGDRP